jgi:hypothetical protein
MDGINYDQQIEKMYHPENFEKVADDEDDESELWRQHKADMKEMREKRRESFADIFEFLKAQGFEVKYLTPYQVRINNVVDIYPSNKRFHHLKNGKRGDLRMKLSRIPKVIKNLVYDRT